MNKDNKAHEAQPKESEGFLRRLFGRGGHETPGADARPSTRSTLDLGDIQGFILRGYRMPMVRHFLLRVGVPAEARKLLGRFVSGEESDAPQITTAEDWQAIQRDCAVPLARTSGASIREASQSRGRANPVVAIACEGRLRPSPIRSL